MIDLLPSNATKQERAISLATARVASVPVPIRTLWDPQTCPVGVLGWLAWSLSLDDWNTEWTEQQKRDAIAASIEIHRRKGTIGAVRRALQAVGYEVQILEQSDGPYTFAVYLDATNGSPSEAQFAEAERLALNNKNVRSHLTSVGAILRTDAEINLLSTTLDGEDTFVWPFIAASIDSEGVLVLLSGMQDVVTTEILPFVYGTEIELNGTLFLPSPVFTNTTVELN